MSDDFMHWYWHPLLFQYGCRANGCDYTAQTKELIDEHWNALHKPKPLHYWNLI